MSRGEVLAANFEEIQVQLKNCAQDLLLFVVDSEIQKIYFDVIKSLQDIPGKKVLSYVSTSGEDAKGFSESEKMTSFFLEKGIHRKSKVIAIGGGAVTDVAGFFAATALRGIDWWVVPTTLLGMVDAAVGGKTALNSKFGKNLIGSFHYPEKVFINTEFIKSLSSFELGSGLGEVVKYGMINPELGDFLLSKSDDIGQIVMKCACYKNDITSSDFTEKGLRQVLNFGHTIGHAIEKYYSISHGESIFWGMYLILSLYGGKEDLERLVLISKKLKTNFTSPPWLNKTFPVTDLMEFIKKDKKLVSLEEVNLILCTAERGAEIYTENLDSLRNKLEENKNEFRKIRIEN